MPSLNGVDLYSPSESTVEDGPLPLCKLKNLISYRPHPFAEIQSPDVIIFSADSGGIGELKDISKDDIDNFINSKINGSLGLIKKILSKKHNKKITMIWLAGGMSQKPKELFLYYIINAALNCLVTALNYHYGDNINAYYLETPLVSPSTLGDAFILRYGENYKELSMIPEETAGRVVNILNNKSIFPGLISLENQKGSL